MRKTSQDGGDTSSITSGVENEVKKPSAMKSKRSSIKRKVQNLSHESDDAVIEPLLQRDKEKPGTSNQSAKYLLSEIKTEVTIEREDDKEKLLHDEKPQKSQSDSRNIADTIISISSSSQLPKSTSGSAPLHNHMNTNVFNSPDALKGLVTTKSQILVEIDGSKQSGYNPSPLIFTTAKIHTDGKNKHMEPLQVTPVPILSTIEVSVLKGTAINKSGESSGMVTTNISQHYGKIPKSNINMQEKDQKLTTLPGPNTTLSSKIADTKEKQPIAVHLPSKDKKIIDTTTHTSKNINMDSKFSAHRSNDNTAAENISMATEMKKDKGGKQTKESLSQPIRGSNSFDIKTTAISGTSKPEMSTVNTKTSTISKDSISDLQAQTMKPNKIEDSKVTERITDVNKNFTSVDGRDPKTSEEIGKKPDAISKDKITMNTTNTKQLQRQKIAIDKDDSTTKTKSGLNISSNEIMSSKLPDASTASISKSSTTIKSPINNVSGFAEKTKQPVSTASNTQGTKQIATPSTKHSDTSVATTTVAKSTTSNYISSMKPIITSQSTAPPTTKTSITKTATIPVPPSTTTKTPASIETTASGEIKGVLSSKPQVSRSTSSKPSTSIISTTKTIDTSAKETQSTSQLTSSVKSSTTQSSTKTPVVKPAQQVVVTKPLDSTTNVTSISRSTAKSPPLSTDSAKISSVVAKTTPSTTKSPSATTSTAKSSSASTSITKSPPVTISTAKSTPITSNTVKSTPATTNVTKTVPASTSTVKIPPVSTNTAKTIPITTSASKMPVSTNATKTTPASTNIVKAPAVTNASKLPTTKTNTTPVSKTSVASSTKETAVSTVATAAPTSTTASSAVSKKKDAKSTELSNGNKSLKA